MFSKVLLSLIFLIGPAQAANIPQASSVIQAGGTTNGATQAIPGITIPTGTLPGNIYQICGGVASSSANNFLGLYSQGGPATNFQYVVPATKAFYAINMYVMGTGTSSFQLGYGTANLISDNTSTAPAGAVYYGASSTAASTGFHTGPTNYVPINFNTAGLWWPAGAYPFVKTLDASAVYHLCIQGIVQ